MTASKLQWAKRARVVRSELTVRKQWQSKEGPRVDHVKYNHPAIPQAYQVFHRGLIVSRHRTKAAAFKAAESLVRS